MAVSKELTTRDRQIIIAGLSLYKKEVKSIMTKTENLDLQKEHAQAKQTFLVVEVIINKLTQHDD